MTQFTLSPTADIDGTAAQRSFNIAGLRAGADLAPCTPVTISSDFRVFPAIAGQKFDGVSSPRQTYAGQPVTVFGTGVRFRATDTTLDGSKLYGLASTVGTFDDGATTKVFRPVSRFDLAIIALGLTAL